MPAMRGKGRLQPGRDADVVVFDPETVTDQASYADSTRPSAGIRHVLVNGVFVVRDGGICRMPGRGARYGPSRARRAALAGRAGRPRGSGVRTQLSCVNKHFPWSSIMCSNTYMGRFGEAGARGGRLGHPGRGRPPA